MRIDPLFVKNETFGRKNSKAPDPLNRHFPRNGCQRRFWRHVSIPRNFFRVPIGIRCEVCLIVVDTRVSRPAALAALFVVLAALAAWGLLTASPAAAFQPDGVGPSHGEIALPPCPHGHEYVCDTGGPLRSSSSSTGGTGGDTAKVASALKHEARVSAQVRRNAARSGTGGDGAPADGVRAAITPGISSLPWLIDGANTPTERTTLDLLSETQGLSPELVQRLVTQPFL